MPHDLRDIAESFDRRACHYGRNEWHRRSAERLVQLCGLRPGDCVLDAGTGTGFAALAAARAVGPTGRVVGVDISHGMLDEAGTALEASGLANVAFIEGDALDLGGLGVGPFDAVVCACGLLYMPATEALAGWHRAIRPGGRLAFSVMQAGAPAAGRIFRECAATRGLVLADRSAPLGSVAACRDALRRARYASIEIVSESVEFTAADLALAWESNVASVPRSQVQRLGADALEALRREFVEALQVAQRSDPLALRRAGVIYALARR